MMRPLSREWLLALSLLSVIPLAHAQAQYLEWFRQSGTPDPDGSSGVSADALGNAYIVGDDFVSKYDKSGNLIWKQSFSISVYQATSVAADLLGNVFVSGFHPNGCCNVRSAFVTKYDGSGSLLWTRLLDGPSASPLSNAVTSDASGNVYISGSVTGALDGTYAGGGDAFVSKYDGSGNLMWTRQLGTDRSDEALGVSVDPMGNVFITGDTAGSLAAPMSAGTDVFVSKYDPFGTLQWTRQFGTLAPPGFIAPDDASGVTTDSLGNVYISGSAAGTLPGPNVGSGPGFLVKYDSAGNLQWTRQFESGSTGVSSDSLGGIYVTGSTRSTVSSQSFGHDDAFVNKYDSSGNLQWIQQVGTGGYDFSKGISAGPVGVVYISGSTRPDVSSTDSDAFIAKLSAVPEPTTLLLATLASLLLPSRRARQFRR